MAENLLPEIIPGMVAVEYVGADNKESGEHKGMVKNVFPIDAKELVAAGSYKLVDNGAVEAARLQATPLRSVMAANPDVVVTEVSGQEGQVVTAATPQAADKLRAEQAKDPTAGKGDSGPAKK